MENDFIQNTMLIKKIFTWELVDNELILEKEYKNHIKDIPIEWHHQI